MVKLLFTCYRCVSLYVLYDIALPVFQSDWALGVSVAAAPLPSVSAPLPAASSSAQPTASDAASPLPKYQTDFIISTCEVPKPSGRLSNIRYAYECYSHFLKAKNTWETMTRDGTWNPSVPITNNDIITFFFGKAGSNYFEVTALFKEFNKHVGLGVPGFDGMRAWLKEEPNALSDYEVWGEGAGSSSYSRKQFKMWMNEAVGKQEKKKEKSHKKKKHGV